MLFMVKNLDTGVEVKKWILKDAILPLIGAKQKSGKTENLYVIKRKGYLKLVPKRRVDLTECFDKVDLGVDSIGNWVAFEKKFSEESTMKFLRRQHLYVRLL